MAFFTHGYILHTVLVWSCSFQFMNVAVAMFTNTNSKLLHPQLCCCLLYTSPSPRD